jgi:two-component system response regulator
MIMSYELLLIEDNADDVELAMRAFQTVGLSQRVKVVGNGTEALEYLHGGNPEKGSVPINLPKIILLDLNLPKTPGLEVLRQIRLNDATRAIPVVVLTVSRKEPDLLQSFTMGISDYLIKPLDAERFAQIYRKYVRTDPT